MEDRRMKVPGIAKIVDILVDCPSLHIRVEAV